MHKFSISLWGLCFILFGFAFGCSKAHHQTTSDVLDSGLPRKRDAGNQSLSSKRNGETISKKDSGLDSSAVSSDSNAMDVEVAEYCRVWEDTLDNHVTAERAYVVDANDETAYYAVGSDEFLGDQEDAVITLYEGPIPERFSTIDCSCEPGNHRKCGESDVGECKTGIQTCLEHVGWGLCEGYIDPMDEQCDGKDNNCDGETDEVCVRYEVCTYDDQIRISKADPVDALCTTIQLSKHTSGASSALIGITIPPDLLLEHAWKTELSRHCGLDFEETRGREALGGNGIIDCSDDCSSQLDLNLELHFPDGKDIEMQTGFDIDSDEMPQCHNTEWPILSGEPYTVGDTVMLGTLIGYGRFEWIDDVPANVTSTAAGGDVVFGTDLGVNVSLKQEDGQWRSYFFFGDSWPSVIEYWQGGEGQDGLAYEPGYYATRMPNTDSSHGIENGDIIAYTSDNDPDDGIQLDRVFRNEGLCSSVNEDGFRSTFIPTINLACEGNQAGTGGGVPSGVIAIPSQTGDDTILFMWYNTKFTSPPVQSGTYLAYSTDMGMNWTAIRDGDALGTAIPFSRSVGAQMSRFSNLSPILVDASDYQSSDSSPCMLPTGQDEDTRGLLIFAAGRPYRRSDIYLGYLPLSALYRAVAAEGKFDVVNQMVYFAGITQANGPGGCWSDSEQDAVPVLKASDVTPFARIEAPCDQRVVEGVSGAGEIVVRHIQMDLDEGKHFDRLVLLFNNSYLVCTDDNSDDPCCGSTLNPVTNTCSGQLAEEHYPRLVAGNMGINLATGDPMRPWIWNTKAATNLHKGDEVQDERPYVPLFIPVPEPGVGEENDVQGAGAACHEQQWTDAYHLHGYGPYIIEQYTRKSADGQGVDIFFPLSRWKGKADIEGLEAGPYRVDIFRTTIRPE